MFISKLKTTALMALATGLMTTGVVVLARQNDAGPPRPDEPPVAAQTKKDADPFGATGSYEVKPGKLVVNVAGRGTLEAAHSEDVICQVDLKSILKILPEGTRVKKGQLVCELDSANLRDQLVNQRIATQRAEADLEQAKSTRLAAEIAVKEYVDGIFPRDEESLMGEIKQAEAALLMAQANLERTDKIRKRLPDILSAQGGAKTPTQILAELELNERLDAAGPAVGQAQQALRVAQANREILLKYTKEKQVHALQLEVEKAQAAQLRSAGGPGS